MHRLYHQKSAKVGLAEFVVSVAPRPQRGRVSITALAGALGCVAGLPADLGDVLVDAVEGFQHDDGVSADDNHADANLLAACLLF